jgi:hypothetical protein
MSTRIAPQLVCNRLVKEQWEDNEYKIHLKKVIKKLSLSIFPDLVY